MYTNKVTKRGNKWLLPLLLVSFNILKVSSNPIIETENNKFSSDGSLPKVVTMQTFKDWSSRLGSSSNHTTPKTTLLILQESKDVKTTYHNPEHLMAASTQDTISTMRDSLINTPTNAKNPAKNDQINAHNIAAQVLSKFVHISPLLAMPSTLMKTEIPSNHNVSVQDRKDNKNKFSIKSNQNIASINSLNEIDTDLSLDGSKSERKSASGISFPTMPSTTTDLIRGIYETSTTEIPSDTNHGHQEYPHPEEDEEEHHEHDQPQHADHDQPQHTDQDQPQHADHPSEDDEPIPPEDPEDYEDDEEIESFRYPVRVTFNDNDDDPIPARDTSPSFMIPNIDLNPESLKQKGCRTVVKEVQAIPVENGMQKHGPQPPNAISRSKRNSDGNSRKFTSIVMTKECHFPGDEGASSEESPQTAVASNQMSGSKRDNAYQSAPQYDEDDPDFDFKPRLTYPSSGLPLILDETQPKASNNRKKYSNNPNYRAESSSYTPKESDYGFDDNNFYDFNDYMSRREDSRNKRAQMQSSPRSRGQIQSSPRSRGRIQSSPSSDGYDYDDEDYGPRPKSRGRSHNVRSSNKKQPMYRNEPNRNSRQGKGRRKPKKINRSFAFFRRAEPKDKDPNESDYSVSYGRGNFHSFSDSYDSDKDGPRHGRGMTRSRKYE